MKDRALLALLLLGCGGEPVTALDLSLVPSPHLSSEPDLVARLDTLVVVVDAAVGGLYPPGSERESGDIQIKDADGDASDLELVALVPLPADRLPLVRLERGTLPETPLHIRVLGRAEGETGADVARGGVTPVGFTDGEVTPLIVPFNLLPAYLPLMVTDVTPADGDRLTTCTEGPVIQVQFSRAVSPDTLLAEGRFLVEELDPPAPVTPLRVDVELAQAEFVPATPFLDYRVTISAEVTDGAGVHLDQVPAMDGLQPYTAEFHLFCTAGPMTPFPFWCQEGGENCPTAGYQCIDRTCVRATCEGAQCPEGWVCDPAVTACDLDCRLYGGESCPPERPSCDGATGSCI